MTQLKLVMAALVLLGCIEAYAVPPIVPPSYTLTDIGLLPGGYTRTWGNSIDAAGDVVGYCGGSNTLPDHAFRYHDGKLVDLGALFNPVLNTKALYTNVAGDVVLIQPSSTSTYPSLISSNEQPVLYRNGQFITIPFPRGASASVVGLNDFGQIAGNFTAGGALFAYIIERDGCLKILPT
jgi:probable HAF family extracellular repeat protein